MVAHFIKKLALLTAVQQPSSNTRWLSIVWQPSVRIDSFLHKRSFLYQHHNCVACNAPVFAQAVHLFMRLGLQQPSRGHMVVLTAS